MRKPLRLVLRCLQVLATAAIPVTAAHTAQAATLTVTNNSDATTLDGVCDLAGTGDGCGLREAVTAANADTSTADIIQFAPNVRGTIELLQIGDSSGGSSAFALLGPTDIQGPGADVLNVRRMSGGDYRIFLTAGASGSRLSISGLTISNGNLASVLSGGGVRHVGGNLVLNGVVLSNNRAGIGAGLDHSSTGTLGLFNSTVSGNAAIQGAGGIFTDPQSGLATLVNCTFANNSAPSDAAIGSFGNLTLRSSTIAGNSATNDGGGIGRRGGSFTVVNTIVALNTAPSAPDVLSTNGAFTSGGYNLIGVEGAAGFSQTSDRSGTPGATLDPRLGPLRNNGGPTPTRALLAGSPAIDAGLSDQGSDQRKLPRPVDLPDVPNASGGNGSDIGSYEVAVSSSSESLIVTTLVDEDNGTSDPGLGTGTSLREAINFANADTSTADVIQFAPNVRGTIDLLQIGDSSRGNSAFALLGPTDIQGPGADVLNVRRVSGGDYRIFLTAGASGSQLSISGLTISNGNLAGGDLGGGVFHIGGNLALNGVVLSNSQAGIGAGLGHNSTGTLSLFNSTVSGNTAIQGAGGIFTDSQSGPATLVNCTFVNNSAPSDAAIGSFGNLTLRSSTIAGNRAISDGGGGIGKRGGSFTVVNTIVALNTAPAAPDVLSTSGPFTSGGYNLIGVEGAAGFSQTSDRSGTPGAPLDPRLGPLQNNGGPTPTRALLAGSPAIDAGDTTLTTDQRGVVRPQAGRDDIGAFELEASAFTESLVVTTLSDEDNSTSDARVGTGTSLREAINFANSTGNTAPETITFAVSGTITLADVLPTLGDARASGALTIRNAQQGGVTISGGGARRIFDVSFAKLTLEGLTLSGGRAAQGGAINIGGGNVVLANCTLSGNTATSSGGGAIFNAGSGALSLTNCTLSGNTANSSDGGAINSNGFSTLTLTNCTLSGNSANDGGTPGNGGTGGAIFNNFGDVTVTGCTLSGNAAANGGAINNLAVLAVTNSTFAGNRALNNGAAINNSGLRTVTVTNSTFVGNSAASFGGGAISNPGSGTLTVASSTLVGNSAGQAGGGGILNSGTLNLHNSIVVGNTAPIGDNIQSSGTLNAQGRNLTSGTVAEAGLQTDSNGAPVLADNGGPTQTIALVAGSPALDAGTSTGAPSTDQRGVARPQGAGFDIGAFELEVRAVNAPPVANDDSISTPALMPVKLAVLSNDSDVDSDTLSIQSVTQPARGSVVVNSDGTLTYTGDGTLGEDSFTYTIADGQGGTATAKVTVTRTLPASTPNAKVTGSGAITVRGGSASFSLSVQVKKGTPTGSVSFDNSPGGVFVRSISITAIVLDSTGTTARIYGTAKVNGAGSTPFVVEVQDAGEPGIGRDTFRIVVGSDNAKGVLSSGNIQVHKVKVK